ncbi:RNA dependent RNA polymerase-domain-containing protein [Sporodiniella umbellata]|nr:RNA dependent RNA polymerase-domain-containing protein [Sporodiniella umbellata]
MSLDPNILRGAKHVYYHLGLKERVSELSKPNVAFAEIKKMKELLAAAGSSVLDETVKGFFRWSPPRQRKKTIGDFIAQINQELSQTSKSAQDLFEDIDDNAFVQINEKTESGKRPAQEMEEKKVNKKSKPTTAISTKPDTPPSSPSMFFSSDGVQSDDFNVLCSPAKNTRLFSGISWIILYEIGRFMQQCKVPWNEVPFDAFHTFLNTATSDPKKLFEVMMRWNMEKRLGQSLTGMGYSRMSKCPDSVWSYIQSEKPSVTTQGSNDLVSSSPISPKYVNINKDDRPIQNNIRHKLLKNRMVRYGAIVYYKTSSITPRISIRAPKIAASNRLFRKYGQDRFFELTVSTSSNPSMTRHFKDYFLKPIILMQRTFRFLFIKDTTLVFFATEGVDLEPISIQQVIDWHLPILENWDMSMSKYSSRMTLGYSSSIPTVQFKPSEIEYIDDIYSAGAREVSGCMTDGCGIISCAAMKDIMGCQTTDQLPCAVQGRIGGAKGIWIISPDLDFNSGKRIQIRASQLKFKTGLPQANMGIDPHHYTFDLVKNSLCIYPSNLNTQFIQVLASGGVPTQVFDALLIDYIRRMATVLTKNRSVKVLRNWVAKTGNVMGRRWENEEHGEKGIWKNLTAENDMEFDMTSADNEGHDGDHEDEPQEYANTLNSARTFDQVNKYSGFPGSIFESVIRLLDSGFDLSNAFIAARVTAIFRQVMKSITTKYKIEVAQSCTITCIPDPTNTLEPGEVFLQLSSRRVDEITGVSAGLITGDVIVTRNPCGLKSDIQKVKAIDCPALRMYTDVIVFPVKGDFSLASKLSGGDYDGDLIFCCWDQSIVQPFEPCPVIAELDQVKNAFEQDTATVGQLVGVSANTEKALQESFISVQMPDGSLGMYENWRTVQAERTSVDDPNVSYLAQMCARLVDAAKQGLRLKQEIVVLDREKYSHIPHPIWFMDKKNKQRESHRRAYKEVNDVYILLEKSPCVTTMDCLYKTLIKETKRFTKYSKSLFSEEDVHVKDPDLISPWFKTYQYATQRNDKDLEHDLDLIEKTIEASLKSFFKQSTQYYSQRQHLLDNVYNPQKYVEGEVLELYASFTSFFELEEYTAKDFMEEPLRSLYRSKLIEYDLQTNNGQLLQTLKASCAYKACVASRKYTKFPYVVAFNALRRIKSDAIACLTKENGLAETISPAMYQSLNIDKKWLKKIKESALSLS